jgi:CheY-like chemotaxis protein
MMRTCLEVYGYKVCAESDGMAAVRVAATEPIDAVITDFHMPGLSGENLCREIRRAKPQMPILMFTGSPATLPPGVKPLVDVLLSKDQNIEVVADALEQIAASRQKFGIGSTSSSTALTEFAAAFTYGAI